MAGYDYSPIGTSGDYIITDGQTGEITGIRNNQDQIMTNGVTDIASSFGGGLTTIAGRNITIPQYSQAIIAGGVTISSGSITATGEFVANSY